MPLVCAHTIHPLYVNCQAYACLLLWCRHVMVPNPDVEGRRQILEGAMKTIPRGADLDLSVSQGDSFR